MGAGTMCILICSYEQKNEKTIGHTHDGLYSGYVWGAKA